MMTAQEYRDRKDELEKQITNLIEERERMVLERMNIIRNDLADIGLEYGKTVDILDGIYERECVFNGVHRNAKGRIYLEFVWYDPIDGTGVFPYDAMHIVDTFHDFVVVLPNATFNYQTFMSNYQ